MGSYTQRTKHKPGLFDGLYELRLEGTLCDAEIVCKGGVALKAHAVVLAGVTSYFRAMFAGPWKEIRQDARSLKLDDVDPATVEFALAAIYGEKDALKRFMLASSGPISNEECLEFDLPAVEACFELLNFLDISEGCQCFLTQVVLDILGVDKPVTIRSQKKQRCVVLLLCFAHQANLGTLQRELERLASYNLEDILSLPEDLRASFGRLPLECLVAICDGRSNFCGSYHMYSRFIQAKAAVVWLAANPISDTASLLAMLQQLHCSPNDDQFLRGLTRLAEEESSKDADNTPIRIAIQQVQQACATVPRPARQPRLVYGGIVVCGGREDDWTPAKTVELFKENAGQWKCSAAPPCTSTFVCGAAIPGGVLVLPGSPTVSAASVYDAATHAWRPAGEMRRPRLHAAAACLADSVYVTGGKSGQNVPAVGVSTSMEIYSAAENRWTWDAADLLEPRCCHGAAALNDRLYVTGGQSLNRLYGSTHSYDPRSDSWQHLQPQLRQERKYLSLAAFEGRLYAVGGMDRSRSRLCSVEAWDPRDPTGWVTVAPLSTKRSSSSLAVLHGRLYAIGGTDNSDSPLSTVEAFHPPAGKWFECAPLNVPRTGHLAAVC